MFWIANLLQDWMNRARGVVCTRHGSALVSDMAGMQLGMQVSKTGHTTSIRHLLDLIGV